MLGTGWLGWSPDVVLDTPMPQLFLALKGKVDFVKKTNPFGSGEEKPEPTTQEGKDKLTAWSIKKAEFLKNKRVKNG